VECGAGRKYGGEQGNNVANRVLNHQVPRLKAFTLILTWQTENKSQGDGGSESVRKSLGAQARSYGRSPRTVELLSLWWIQR
jgi:hypothetical protein